MNTKEKHLVNCIVSLKSRIAKAESDGDQKLLSLLNKEMDYYAK